jgi:uncharacterized YigZ family protein
MMNEYKTVIGSSEETFIEKKSRFIGTCFHVTSAEEAVQCIDSVKKKYWEANHHVYAYELRSGGAKKYSDDGEPQGTAGIPVLGVIEKAGLVDICIIVTRYFGGILLGGGGLLRAYSHTASISLNAAKTAVMRKCTRETVTTEYSKYELTVRKITDYGATVDNSDFSDKVDIIFHIETDKIKALLEEINEINGGKATFTENGEEYLLIHQ